MVTVELAVAEKLAGCIRNRFCPGAALDAVRLRDRWLWEHDMGLLRLSTETRSVLILAEYQNEDLESGL